jgi:hypothetical protein
MFGAEDPDLRREVLSPEEMVEVVLDFYRYFTELTADRQAQPTDDLATLIANGTIDVVPGIACRAVGDQRIAQVSWKLVHHTTEHTRAAHRATVTPTQFSVATETQLKPWPLFVASDQSRLNGGY